DIVHRCRTYSSRRSKLREFEFTVGAIEERLASVHQGGLSQTDKSSALAAAETAVQKLETIIASKLLSEERVGLEARVAAVKTQVAAAGSIEGAGDPLVHVSPEDRAFYQRMIGLIYKHSVSHVAAKSLVDRILSRELESGAQ